MAFEKITPLAGNVDKEEFVDLGIARGSRWKRLRNISSQGFTLSNLKLIMPIIDDSVKRLLEHLDVISIQDKAFDIHKYFQELSMDIISRVALGETESHLFESSYLALAIRWVDRLNIFPLYISLIILIF
uniref:Cytochrome P450 n=1 Tax=Acrobeloides nanus TaxID=290746 RepID=A0A914ELZ3_9BILA